MLTGAQMAYEALARDVSWPEGEKPEKPENVCESGPKASTTC